MTLLGSEHIESYQVNSHSINECMVSYYIRQGVERVIIYPLSLYQAGIFTKSNNISSVTILGREQKEYQCMVSHYIRQGVDRVPMYGLSMYQAGSRKSVNVWSVTILGREQKGCQCMVCHYIRLGVERVPIMVCHNIRQGVERVPMYGQLLYQAGIRRSNNISSVTILGREQNE